MPHTLDIPDWIQNEKGARQVVSAWILQNGKLLIVHEARAFTDPKVWGILLADLARYVADAHRKLDGSYPFEEIVEMFNAEVTNPTTNYETRLERTQWSGET